MVNILKDSLDVLRDVSKMISSEIGCNIIICDHEGEIIEATQKERIGRSHVGSKIIMSGLTDEAVISEAQAEAFQKLGTDTRVGYNYVIIVRGQRAGSLGMAGEAEYLKPMVRIAAKTIGLYISEYLKEKEKNKIIQKMARIAEELTERNKGGLDYHVFTDDLLLISGARSALCNIYNPDRGTSFTAAISGKVEDIKASQEILGYSLLGKQWRVNNSLLNQLRKKRMVTFPSLAELPEDFISGDQVEELNRILGLGRVCITEIAHKESVIGEFLIILDKDATLKNEVLVEFYSAQVGHLLKKAEVEAALKKSESKYRILVEKLNGVIFNLDKQGYIRYISPAIKELLDYIPEEMIGTSFASYVYPYDLDNIHKVLKSNVMGNDESIVIRILNKADKAYHVRVSTRLIQEDEEERVLGVMTDVTDLQQTLNILDSFWKHSPNPISILDKNSKIIRISKAGANLLGKEPEMLEGKKITEVFSYPVAEKMEVRIQAINDMKKPQSYTDSINFNHAENRHYDSWLFPITNEEEDTILVGMVALDSTDRIQTEERLNYLSFHDPITGLYNRTYFEGELKRLERSDDYPISVISIDADDLKTINDTMGHNMGDEFLKNLAQILKQTLRDSDILARVGGDEFVVFLPNTDKLTVGKIAERIRRNIQEYNQQNLMLPLSVSLGLETAERAGDSLEDVLKKADEHMYNNKFFRKRNSQSQILNSFMASLGKKDFVSQGYAEMLFKLFTKISQSSRLPSGTLKALVLLAQVHDLGNVTIPDSILSKPTPLNDDEWKEIRLHPEKGSKIAATSPDLVDISELIMRHHERWDGRGYPLGLKGKEIPIECRILAVVDAFNAMITEKPYRKALSKLGAIKELKRCAGTQFDPEIVDFFIDTLIEEGSKGTVLSLPLLLLVLLPSVFNYFLYHGQLFK